MLQMVWLIQYRPRLPQAETSKLAAQFRQCRVCSNGRDFDSGPAVRQCPPMDVEAEQRIVRADPTVIGLDPTPLLIGEWQRVPGIFDVVRPPRARQNWFWVA